MIHELLIASQSVQSLGSLLKAAHGLSNYNEIVAALAEVHAKLMQANAVALASQEKQAASAARVQELEQEVMRLKDWSAEAQQYEAPEIARGVFAHVKKDRVGALQSTHKLCSNCFEQSKKSLLQRSREPRPLEGLICHRCERTIVFRHYGDQT